MEIALRHTAFDNAVFVLLLALPLVELKWSWPRYLAALASGAQNARSAFYRRMIIAQWVPTACLLAFWATRNRPWSQLRLVPASPLRLGLGITCTLLPIAFLLFQRRAFFSLPDRRERLRNALGFAEPLIPHTEPERRLFWMVSFTAGVCEEIFFRGFLTWYFSAWMSPLAAAVLSSIIFGTGHLYLGAAQVPKTTVVGLIFAMIASLSQSLFPAMLLHAVIDWNSGEMGFRILSDSAQEPHVPSP